MTKERQRQIAKEVADSLYKQMFTNYGLDWTYSDFWSALAKHVKAIADKE